MWDGMTDRQMDNYHNNRHLFWWGIMTQIIFRDCSSILLFCIVMKYSSHFFAQKTYESKYRHINPEICGDYVAGGLIKTYRTIKSALNFLPAPWAL
jgi:hypothetical protein